MRPKRHFLQPVSSKEAIRNALKDLEGRDGVVKSLSYEHCQVASFAREPRNLPLLDRRQRYATSSYGRFLVRVVRTLQIWPEVCCSVMIAPPATSRVRVRSSSEMCLLRRTALASCCSVMPPGRRRNRETIRSDSASGMPPTCEPISSSARSCARGLAVGTVAWKMLRKASNGWVIDGDGSLRLLTMLPSLRRLGHDPRLQRCLP